MKRYSYAAAVLMALLLCFSSASLAADAGMPSAMKRWVKDESFSTRDGEQHLSVTLTYYSNEYIDEMIKYEADKNLWTNDEAENYRYTLMKTLNLNDSISFHISFNVSGVPMYLQPFDRHISLMIRGKQYRPSYYDERFNFKILGDRDGVVSFPRYDPDTGKDLLEGASDIRLILDSSISIALSGRGDKMWVWDIAQDMKYQGGSGEAMARLELDRLIKRMEKLNADRREIQKQLDAVDAELNTVNERIETLQTR